MPRNIIEYHDHPNEPGEEHKIFSITTEGEDYILSITDVKRNKTIVFRWCMSGGFAESHPETTLALANLHRAFEKETSDEK